MLITLIYIFVSAIALLFAIYEFSGIRRFYNKTAHIPGPLTLPLIRCGLSLIGSVEYIFNRVYELTKIYGSPTRFALGHRIFLSTMNPDQIKTILSSSITAEKDEIYKLMVPIIGNGLLVSEYKIWRSQRKYLQPAFASKILQNYVTIFQKNSLSLTRAVENHIGSSEFELSPHIITTVFSNISETTMGISLETKSAKVMEGLLKIVQRGLELTFDRIIMVWLHVDEIFKLSQTGKASYESFNKFNNFIQGIIQENRNMKTVSLDKDELEMKTESTVELMLELKDNKSQFTDEEIRLHTMALIFAGYDTSLRVLNFLFLMIASHPDIQDRAYEEIFKIYGQDDPEFNPLKYEDLSKLNYLERVIKETLRLFPPVPYVARQVSEDFELDGCLMPKNCGVLAFIIGLHRDEKFWPDPLKFDPDRFLPEAVNERHPGAYVPFSSGPRDCIGRTYAMMSLKIIMATFLRKYVVKKDKILPVKDIKLSVDAFLRAVDPIKIRIEKRVK